MKNSLEFAKFSCVEDTRVEKLGDQIPLEQKFLIKTEVEHASSSFTPCLHSLTNYPKYSPKDEFNNSLEEEKKYGTSNHLPQKTYEPNELDDDSFIERKIYKKEKKFYEISDQYDYKNRGTLSLQEEGPCIFSEKYKIESSEKLISQKFSKKQGNCFGIAEFYQKEMNNLIRFFGYSESNSVLSGELHDYKRAQLKFSKEYQLDEKMELEVLDSDLSSFDSLLAVPNSFRYLSRNQERNLFQKIIKNKINSHLKSNAFCQFVRLSLGKDKTGDHSYLSWKKEISKNLSLISSDVKKIIFTCHLNKDLGKAKNGDLFEKNYLSFYKKNLIKQIMRHALFSICIEVDKESKKVFISRASMGYLLNRYSDCFLKEIITYQPLSILRKSIKASYSLWKKSRNKNLMEIEKNARLKFNDLLESDYERIRQEVLILDDGKFRLLTNKESIGVMKFIRKLVDYKGYSGIVERAFRHFYRKEHSCYRKNYHIVKSHLFEDSKDEKNHVYQHIDKEYKDVIEKDLIHPLKNDPWKTEEKCIFSSSSPSDSRKIKKEKPPKRKINCFKSAENYRRLMTSFLQKKKKLDDLAFSSGIYDYSRVQYDSNVLIKKHEKIKIEITDDHLASLDPLLAEVLPQRKRFSENFKRREFQKKLLNEINQEISNVYFMHFILMSFPDTDERKTKNYFSWKKEIFKEVDERAKIFSSEIFGTDCKKKGVSVFLNRYSSFCSNILIKNILRHALFLIPAQEKGNHSNFFVSRINMSQFFNRYSNEFLTIFSKFLDVGQKFAKRTNSSYSSWKKSIINEFNEACLSFKTLFTSLLRFDQDSIRRDVLVFEKGVFREITDSEFGALMDVIHDMGKPEVIFGFIDRASRHLYKKRKNG